MPPASLTRRGEAVLTVAVLGFALGYAFGGRSLNAVVVPAFEAEVGVAVVVVAGMLLVEWSRFRAEREPEPTGFAAWFLPEDPRE